MVASVPRLSRKCAASQIITSNDYSATTRGGIRGPLWLETPSLVSPLDAHLGVSAFNWGRNLSNPLKIT